MNIIASFTLTLFLILLTFAHNLPFSPLADSLEEYGLGSEFFLYLFLVGYAYLLGLLPLYGITSIVSLAIGIVTELTDGDWPTDWWTIIYYAITQTIIGCYTPYGWGVFLAVVLQARWSVNYSTPFVWMIGDIIWCYYAKLVSAEVMKADSMEGYLCSLFEAWPTILEHSAACQKWLFYGKDRPVGFMVFLEDYFGISFLDRPLSSPSTPSPPPSPDIPASSEEPAVVAPLEDPVAIPVEDPVLDKGKEKEIKNKETFWELLRKDTKNIPMHPALAEAAKHGPLFRQKTWREALPSHLTEEDIIKMAPKPYVSSKKGIGPMLVCETPSETTDTPIDASAQQTSKGVVEGHDKEATSEPNADPPTKTEATQTDTENLETTVKSIVDIHVDRKLHRIEEVERLIDLKLGRIEEVERLVDHKLCHIEEVIQKTIESSLEPFKGGLVKSGAQPPVIPTTTPEPDVRVVDPSTETGETLLINLESEPVAKTTPLPISCTPPTDVTEPVSETTTKYVPDAESQVTFENESVAQQQIVISQPEPETELQPAPLTYQQPISSVAPQPQFDTFLQPKNSIRFPETMPHMMTIPHQEPYNPQLQEMEAQAMPQPSETPQMPIFAYEQAMEDVQFTHPVDPAMASILEQQVDPQQPMSQTWPDGMLGSLMTTTSPETQLHFELQHGVEAHEELQETVPVAQELTPILQNHSAPTQVLTVTSQEPDNVMDSDTEFYKELWNVNGSPLHNFADYMAVEAEDVTEASNSAETATEVDHTGASGAMEDYSDLLPDVQSKCQNIEEELTRELSLLDNEEYSVAQSSADGPEVGTPGLTSDFLETPLTQDDMDASCSISSKEILEASDLEDETATKPISTEGFLEGPNLQGDAVKVNYNKDNGRAAYDDTLKSIEDKYNAMKASQRAAGLELGPVDETRMAFSADFLGGAKKGGPESQEKAGAVPTPLAEPRKIAPLPKRIPRDLFGSSSLSPKPTTSTTPNLPGGAKQGGPEPQEKAAAVPTSLDQPRKIAPLRKRTSRNLLGKLVAEQKMTPNKGSQSAWSHSGGRLTPENSLRQSPAAINSQSSDFRPQDAPTPTANSDTSISGASELENVNIEAAAASHDANQPEDADGEDIIDERVASMMQDFNVDEEAARMMVMIGQDRLYEDP
ncbi:hypothetical protein F4806DRAFT_496703 [Annulohypoxylon nitens]|nr:hypothetical protein F4806DRAFT_496703 [Annulohypoxylon nitens]